MKFTWTADITYQFDQEGNEYDSYLNNNPYNLTIVKKQLLTKTYYCLSIFFNP